MKFTLQILLLISTFYLKFSFQEDTCTENSNIKITEFEIPGNEVTNLIWPSSKQDFQVVFVRTRENNLWRSSDEGRTWYDQATKLKEQKGTKTNSKYGVKEVIKSANPDILYFVGVGGDMWVTTDRGQSYTFITGIANLNRTIAGNPVPHPTNGNMLLIRVSTFECSSNIWSPGCISSVIYTKDAGKTWSVIAQYARTYHWGHENTIWFENATTTAFNSNYDLRSTDDFGNTFKTQLVDTAGFVIKFGNLFAAQFGNNGYLRLYSSRDRGVQPFQQARIPVDLEQTSYTILDSDEDAVFINVEHGEDNWGNIYVSNEAATDFVLSLEQNRRTRNGGHCDFAEFFGLSGVYIANYYDDPTPTSDDGVKTVITYNNGGKWTSLTPPKKDSNGKPINCWAKGCGLNLHGSFKREDESLDVGSDSIFGPVYTTHRAIGLIMATGNVGQYLSNSLGDVSTWFSRDAGWTWSEVRKGSYTYEFGDHGSIIVLGTNQQVSNNFVYTLNEGDWNTCTLPQGKSLQTTAIVAEPTATSQTFIAYGSKTINNQQSAVIVRLDFSGVFPRTCNDSDYELWYPHDASGRNCILGRKLGFLRRKQDANCYNGNEHEVKYIEGVCPCAQEDYECDYCFVPHSIDDGVCVPDPICGKPDNDPPVNCVDYFYVSRGYRIVDNDVCNPSIGLNLLPVKVKCPSQDSSSSDNHKGGSKVAAAVIAIVVVIAVIGSCIGGMFVLARKNERFRSAVFQRLPGRFRDPFQTVVFTRLSNAPEDDIEPNFDAPIDEPKELNEEDIVNFTSDN